MTGLVVSLLVVAVVALAVPVIADERSKLARESERKYGR